MTRMDRGEDEAVERQIDRSKDESIEDFVVVVDQPAEEEEVGESFPRKETANSCRLDSAGWQ